MGIVGTAQERPNSPTGGGGINKRTWTRTFLVQTDSYSDGPFTVAAAPGIPKLYSLYTFGNERDDYARLREVRPERIEPNSLFWEVTCEYSTPEVESETDTGKGSSKREVDGQQDVPTLQLPEIETSFEKYQQVVYGVFDVKTGQLTPCRASNKQVFDPPPVKENSRLIITITRNEDINSDHPAQSILYQDAVNSDTWWSQPPGTFKCQAITAQRQTKNTSKGTIIPYLRVTYKFEGRPYQQVPGDNWDLVLLDAGTYYLNDIGGQPPVVQKLKFISDDGHPITHALDGKGNPLPDGANPVWLTFRVYKRLPFGALLLPQQFIQFA
jgi:hypothetical protein